MKNAVKTRTARATPTGTRAGKGGRKQAQGRLAEKLETQELLAADDMVDPHPARTLAGEVGDGQREQLKKGAASAKRGRGPSTPPAKALMRQSSVAPRAEPSRAGAKQWTAGRRAQRKYR